MSRELSVPCSFLRKVAGVPTKFRQKELELATDNFNALIGRGASGSVFKGILGDGTCVAVKRIESQERGEKEFLSEVAAIGSVQHINLVRLYGYCIVPGGPRFLVYEFIQNGSLDGWIFPRRDKRNRPAGCLPWHLRYGVAIDVAKALSYLHHDCRSRILHLDVKPENILLDDNYRAVVSDFGLAKLMGRGESSIFTNIRGTKGYLAPEWLLENGISAKSDVYSYGMVLLEMIGGRRSVRVLDDSKDRSVRKYEYFPKTVVEKAKEGKFMSLVDQRLLEGRHIDERQVRTLVYTALWCIQEKVRRRPTMAQVVDMLEGNMRVDEPPETEMIIVDLLSIDKDKVAPGMCRLKATGVVLSDCNTAASTSTFEPGTLVSGR
ncbi:probable receptor-like protein kinase At5g20050 isoform X3 [Chenopodium quinoa]|nr:probable receptor-like protein kinase At5g20050 isoform X3 [Chenopodium quinoa]